MRSIVTAIATAAVLVAAAPAHGQERADAPLFASDAPLRLRFVGDLKPLINDRDSLSSTDHPFTLTYQVGDGPAASVELALRTRGHWRRQQRNCTFPPLRVNLPKSKVEGTVFDGQDKLKLVTPCRPGRDEFHQYVLREYLVYPIYNLLTPLSLKARLATTTYVDTRGLVDSIVVPTFLLEDADHMAERNGGTLLDVRGARFDDVDSLQLGLVGVFLYMIGGTDWSLSGLHNMELVQQQRDIPAYYPVAYDFDWTGIVNTRYARPDNRLRLRSVRDRLYRARCLSEEHWRAVVARFQEHKAAFYALYRDTPGLEPRYVQDTIRFLDEFYEVLDDPGKMNRELIRSCRKDEGF